MQGFYKTLSPGGNPRRELPLVLAKYSRCSTASCSSLLIQVADDNVYPMEYLHRITKGLDESQFISLLGMLKQKPAEALSPIEAAIFKCRQEIGRLRDLSNKEAGVEQANVVTLRNVRLHVQPSSQFNNIFLGLALEFADLSVWPYDLPEGGVTCSDWFAHPELHGSLTLWYQDYHGWRRRRHARTTSSSSVSAAHRAMRAWPYFRPSTRHERSRLAPG